MTTAEAPQLILHQVRLNEADAMAAQRNAGYIVAEIMGDGRSKQVSCNTSKDEACLEAQHLAALNRGRTFGAFKLCNQFRSEPV